MKGDAQVVAVILAAIIGAVFGVVVTPQQFDLAGFSTAVASTFGAFGGVTQLVTL